MFLSARNDYFGRVSRPSDEGSTEWSADQDDATSTASSMPDKWGSTSSVYAISVPPWYGRSTVLAMTGATGQQRLVADRARFSVGELRTCTWKPTGPEASQPVGHLLRSTEGHLPVHIIAAQDYSARRGSRKPRNTAKREPQRPPSVHEMMDLDSTKFMKHKRMGDEAGSPP